MANQGTKTYTINPGGSQTIPAGYHSGSGTVTANANQNSGTYTFASGSAGATVDMGINNTYRYVNATNVYSAGQANGKNSWRYTATNGINLDVTVSLLVNDIIFYHGATTDYIQIYCNGTRMDHDHGGGYYFYCNGLTVNYTFESKGSTWQSGWICTITTAGSWRFVNGKELYVFR